MAFVVFYASRLTYPHFHFSIPNLLIDADNYQKKGVGDKWLSVSKTGAKRQILGQFLKVIDTPFFDHVSFL